MHRFTTALSAVALSLALGGGAAWAADYGTSAEAKEMLNETVQAMKSDEKGTIKKINAGEMKDRDLYPFCGDPDGKVVAHPSEKVRAMNLKELKDKTGKSFGEEMYKKAEMGKVNEVSYMWPRPDEQEPVQKVAYVTKVDDMVCAVGYYK